MKIKTSWRVLGLLLALLLVPVPVHADTSSSTNYRVDQTFFGSGGELNACSSGAVGYCSKQTAGELAVGNTKSTNYGAYAGFNTTDDPYLELVAGWHTIDLGILDAGTASVTQGSFYVRAWQAGGYTIRSESNPPKSDTGYTIPGLSSQTASTPGTEQFGINLVANTTGCGAPADFGADPVQDNSASFGQLDGDYDDCGVFKYAKSDRIAFSTQSSSITTYMVSYLFNISATTPAGRYTFVHNIVVTGNY